jgi:hypothetical protein
MKGKLWTIDEEQKLRELIQAGDNANLIAAKLGKTEHGVYEKARRLGLRVIITNSKRKLTTHEIQLPPELPSVEEALKILAGALKEAAKPDLNSVEVQRLQVTATLARTYKELLADYIDYRGIESKLVELEGKYAQLVQGTKSNVPTPDRPVQTQPTPQ